MSTFPSRLDGAGEAFASPAPAVVLTGITKRFGSVLACDGVDLTLERGRIHGILGENGAGKSTLMKVLIGLVLPDAGSIAIDGEKRSILDPLDAAELGIGMVHQHFSLVESLTVWENVALGESGRLKADAVRKRIGDISDQYGLYVDPYARVGDLTAGLRQRVEIVKCLRRDPSIVIFDEPTSVLTPEESSQLFDVLRNVATFDGQAVVLVSHKLDEVLDSTDDVTIMRRGRVVERWPTSQTDIKSLANAMVGREVSLRSERAALGTLATDPEVDEGEVAEEPHQLSVSRTTAPVLEIDSVRVVGPGGVLLLDNLNLRLWPGEIVGVAGVEGNGQRALADLLSSLTPVQHGMVEVDGESISTSKAGAMGRAGIAVIPEDRHDSGVVLDMTVAENLVLTDQYGVSRSGVIDLRSLTGLAERMIDDFDIQCSGADAPMWSLSGGNQQRVVLARELSNSPKILVAAQPTRGLDVGAIEYMTDRIRAAAASGVAVLLISSELEEIMDLSDRILVMHRGQIVGEMDRPDADLERLGLLMGGATV